MNPTANVFRNLNETPVPENPSDYGLRPLKFPADPQIARFIHSNGRVEQAVPYCEDLRCAWFDSALCRCAVVPLAKRK